jgi:hypothetical protein
MRKESPNGRAKGCLASDEWEAVAYLSDGQNGEMRGSFPRLVVFIGVGVREVRGGPLDSASDVSVELDR